MADSSTEFVFYLWNLWSLWIDTLLMDKQSKNIRRAQYEVENVLKRHQVKLVPKILPGNKLTKLLVGSLGKRIKFEIQIGLQ